MSDSIEPGWVTRVRFTPLSELLRGDVNGRLHWRHVIASADLPAPAAQLVLRVTKRTRLWNKERRAVAEELIAHFQDGLAAGENSQTLIDNYGDERIAARLMRRAKKRNRPLIWQAWVFALRCLGAVLLVYTLFFARFMLSRPTVSVDYLAQLNAPNVAAPVEDRAWPIYRKAILALDINKPQEVAPGAFVYGPGLEFDVALNDPGWPKVTHWLDGHTDGLELVRVAAAKPALGFILGHGGSQHDPELGWYMDEHVGAHDNALLYVLLPDLNSLRSMAQILAADARYAQVQHDGGRAVRDVDAIIGIGRQQRDSLLVTRLVAIGIYASSFEAIEGLLRQDASLFSTEQLIQLAHRVASVGGDSASSLLDLSGERALFQDLVQRIYSDDGHGRGALTYRGVQFLTETAGLRPTTNGRDHAINLLSRSGVTSAMSSRADVTDEWNRDITLTTAVYARPLRDPDGQRLARQLARRVFELKTSPWLQVRFLPVAIAMPGLVESAMRAERLLGQRDGIEIGLALEVYRRQHGSYPATLAALAPHYLPMLPVDRIMGGPLKYRLIGGRPVIYSVGADGKDDGGRPALSYDKKPWPSAAAEWLLPSDQQPPPDGDWVLFDLRPSTPASQPAH